MEESQEGCAKGSEERKDFQKGAEVSVSETPLFRPIGSVPTSGAGAWFSEKRGHGTRANGSFPKEAGRLSEKSPAGHRRRTIGTTPPGSAGVPPASSPFACRSVSPRFGSRPPCRREPHGPGRSRAPGAVAGRSGSRRWARLCQDLCGRDARAPGGASSHDIVTPRAQIRRSIRAPLVIEGGPSVFGPMGATGQPQGMPLLGGGSAGWPCPSRPGLLTLPPRFTNLNSTSTTPTRPTAWLRCCPERL